MSDDAADKILVRQMMNITESDLSILRAALQQAQKPAATGFGRKQQDVSLATIPGSANDQLWGQFEKRNWVAEQEVPAAIADKGPPTKFYALLPEGREPIRHLLVERDAAVARRNSLITETHNERCLPFVNDLVATVRAAGGDGVDIAALMALMVKRAVQLIALPDKQETVLDDIARTTRSALERDAAAAGSNGTRR